MARYSITLLGKSEDGIDYKFGVDANISSDSVAHTYAVDLIQKRLERTFVGNWWVEKILNEETGKRVLLRDE